MTCWRPQATPLTRPNNIGIIRSRFGPTNAGLFPCAILLEKFSLVCVLKMYLVQCVLWIQDVAPWSAIICLILLVFCTRCI